MACKTEFTSEAGVALRLTVRQSVRSKGGLKKLGCSTLVFDFQPAGSATVDNSQSSSGRSTPPRDTAVSDTAAAAPVEGAEGAAAAARAGEPGGRLEGTGEDAAAAAAAGGGGRRNGESPDCVVFVHDRVSAVFDRLNVRLVVCTTAVVCCCSGSRTHFC